MARLDNNLVFSSAQALTATAVATNVVDITVAQSIGGGEPMAVVFCVTVAADQGTGDETYQFDIEYSTNAAQSTGRQSLGRRIFQAGSPTAPNQDADLLVAGYQFHIPVPAVAAGEDERYFGVRYTLSGTTPSVTITSFLTPLSMVDTPKTTYASGYSVT